ncbi:hypothetical protein H1R20_g3170, partial [Candolleomyces eurysporus]
MSDPSSPVSPVSPLHPSGRSQNDPVPDSGFDYTDEGTEWGDKPDRDGRGKADKPIKVTIKGKPDPK